MRKITNVTTSTFLLQHFSADKLFNGIIEAMKYPLSISYRCLAAWLLYSFLMSAPGPRHSTVDVFKKRTMAGLQQHAGTLATPGDSKQIKHQILGTDNSDNVSNIDIAEISRT